MMEFTFEVTEGSTSEISHEFGFTYGVTTGLTVGSSTLVLSFDWQFGRRNYIILYSFYTDVDTCTCTCLLYLREYWLHRVMLFVTIFY